MMKIKKILMLGLATIMSVSALTACGSKQTDKDENGRTIISIGSWPTKEGKDLDAINEKKVRYEASNPDAVIVPDNWSFDLKTFYAKAAGGNLPTVFGTNYTEVSQVIGANYSADLTNVLNKRGYDGMFNKNVLNVISKDNKTYAFPTDAYVLGIAYNTELFQTAGLMENDGTPKQPKDWYELAEFAKKIKAATGKAGVVFPTSTNHGGWIFTPVWIT